MPSLNNRLYPGGHARYPSLACLDSSFAREATADPQTGPVIAKHRSVYWRKSTSADTTPVRANYWSSPRRRRHLGLVKAVYYSKTTQPTGNDKLPGAVAIACRILLSWLPQQQAEEARRAASPQCRAIQSAARHYVGFQVETTALVAGTPWHRSTNNFCELVASLLRSAKARTFLCCAIYQVNLITRAPPGTETSSAHTDIMLCWWPLNGGSLPVPGCGRGVNHIQGYLEAGGVLVKSVDLQIEPLGLMRKHEGSQPVGCQSGSHGDHEQALAFSLYIVEGTETLPRTCFDVVDLHMHFLFLFRITCGVGELIDS
ncbi:hypothetical protein HJFPF1_10171 [Paramyrothecium foliicola]|nr:hypothetical protein HJFPF1_10171 [Paramyrothecium foliicola]